MTPEQLFEQLSTYLEQNAETMTEQDVQMWSNKIYSLKHHTDSMLEDFSLREIAFIQFFEPELTELTFEYESQYDDEGGYYDSYYGLSHTGFKNPSLWVFVFNWAFNFTSEMGDPRYIDLEKRNQHFVSSLTHPLLNLFTGYTPTNTEGWTNLWTLLSSTDMALFNQGCALLEGLLEGDEELQKALLSNYELSDLNTLLDFHCNKWWMVLFLHTADLTTEEYVADEKYILSTILEVELNSGWDFSMDTEPPLSVQKNVMRRVYTWIHRAMVLNQVSDPIRVTLIENASDFVDLTTQSNN